MSDKDRGKPDDSDAAEDEEREGSRSTAEGKCDGCGGKGKKLSFFRSRKKKLLQQKRKQKGIFVNSRRWDGGGGWCCFCVKLQKTLESSGESPKSDPNSSVYTFDTLRTLIEKNDFYSKECNPHLDGDD